jgi:acyl-CoA reductase-like NAD-dependent aldehyde dehydrogenase
MRNYGHWLNGQEHEPSGGKYLERLSPANGESLGAYALGNAADVDAAIRCARARFESGVWSQIGASDRGGVLMKLADLLEFNREALSRLEAEESGKPITAARGEVDYSVALTRFAASNAWNIPGQVMSHNGPDKLGVVLYEPRGVVALIVPWNYPVVCLMQKLPFALAAGCTIVAKPSEFTSGTALMIARLLKEAGLPDGVFNVITGTGEDVGEHLVTHPDTSMISFTGSSAIGRRVARNAGDGIKRVALELGGKGANIIFADADLDAALEGAIQGFIINKGEECCAGGRILVERPIAGAFLARLEKRAKEIRLGLPLDESTEMGPLISPRQMSKVLGYIESGKREGATLITGGARELSAPLANGCYIQPTIFADVTPQMTINREEIFGPVAAVIPFDGLDEAVALTNDTPYGLANGVWTSNVDKAIAVIRRVRSGMVYVNTFLETIPQLPFGGMKQSGIGRENGLEGMLEFLEQKSAFIRLRTKF